MKTRKTAGIVPLALLIFFAASCGSGNGAAITASGQTLEEYTGTTARSRRGVK